jgi:branched-subunit amino acid ABC-type transport system permease component
VRAVVIGGIGSLMVTGLGAVLFPALRRADALSTESLMPANIQQSIAEPMD